LIIKIESSILIRFAHWYMFNIIICKTTNSHQGTLYYMLWWELYAFKMIFDFFVKIEVSLQE